MPEPITFADRLREALDLSGKKPVDIYRALGVSKATWYTWTGERESVPSAETCLRLARELGVEARWLLTGQGDKVSVKKPYTQDQVDIAEAWPHLPPETQKHIAVLLRQAVLEMAPALRASMKPGDEILQKRADRILEEAQMRFKKAHTRDK